MNTIVDILNFILEALGRTWPFLLVSLPLSVAVNMSGAGEKVKSLIGMRPALSILLATMLGALSPLCACTVIPVIFSLLTAGVPLGPVMAFWIASPSMDPEIFFLSVGTLGWNLAVWRLVSTFLLSLASGYAAHFLDRRGYFSGGILKSRPSFRTRTLWSYLKPFFFRPAMSAVTGESCCASEACGAERPAAGGETPGCSPAPGACGTDDPAGSCPDPAAPLWKRIVREAAASLLFVARFLVVAYFIEALIVMFVPESWISAALGGSGAASVGLATLFGLPFYTSNLAALGLLGGLLDKGMVPGAALAFLISGPTTTLPAMSAVLGIARPRVFRLYLSVSFLGALAFGLAYLAFGG